MPAMTIESNPGTFFSVFSANVNPGLEGPDPGAITSPAGHAVFNKLITEGQHLHILFNWSVSGIVTAFGPVDYKLNVYIEKMGVGEAPTDYSFTFTAPVNSSAFLTQTFTQDVPLPSGLAVGLYRITATMTCKLGTINLPTAGFVDLDYIQVYPNS
jgi:hypothetical protein